MTNYKDFQQVLNFSIRPKSVSGGSKSLAPKKNLNKIAVTKPSSTPTNKRTKTGCLTCRKRKKKCDEDKVDGKCQACTRNFLECCWPEAATSMATVKAGAATTIKIEPTIVKVEQGEENVSCCGDKHDYEVSPRLPSIEEQLQLKTPPLSPVSLAAAIYPSPTSSPKLYQNGYRRVSQDFIKPIVLPPIRCNQFKVAKKQTSAPKKSLSEQQTKFVITSFNKDNGLVHVPTV